MKKSFFSSDPELSWKDSDGSITIGARVVYVDGDYSDYLRFRNANSGMNFMVIQGDGDIGIGITNPGNYKLNVAGKIRADEVVVNTTGADFVFKPDYMLLSLSELEKFIMQNKHLPGISPASEMQEKGMNMSEMQTKLLQKIEELTLYVIELKKENEKQNKEIQSLRKIPDDSKY